jgi:hypothetical protein
MTDRTKPVCTVRYTLHGGPGGVTLRDVADFAARLEQLERLGAGHLLHSHMRTVPNSDAVYVEATMPTTAPPRPVPASYELMAENDALRYRLDCIKRHYDDWHADRVVLGDLCDRVEKELKGHAPATAGVSQAQGTMVALYLDHWRSGAVSAVSALENIEGFLGLRPLPPDDEDAD